MKSKLLLVITLVMSLSISVIANTNYDVGENYITSVATTNKKIIKNIESNLLNTPVASIIVYGKDGITTITIHRGTLKMEETVLPAYATDRTVTWSVINGTGSAIINTSGTLTGTANGTVTVKATANDGSGIEGVTEITISNQLAFVTSVDIDAQDDATTITTDLGTLQMEETVLPTNATDKSVTWSVINGTGTASIDDSGLLTAITDGTVTVKATAKDGTLIEGIKEITISNQIVLVTSITVNGQGGANKITAIGGTLQMEEIVNPDNATDKSVTWSVANGTGTATINASGLLTASSIGTVTVKATANDGTGIEETKVITLYNYVTSITVEGHNGFSEINESEGTLQMEETVNPSDAPDKSVTWSIASGIRIAGISASGLLTAKTNGEVTVRATANDGSEIKGTKLVSVSGQFDTTLKTLVSHISVTSSNMYHAVTEGGILQMRVDVEPSDATDKSVTWSVANGTGTATIDDSGLLTAISNGTVTVKATANDRSGVEDTRVITISNHVTSITVAGEGDATTITTNGGTLQMYETVNPDYATDKTVTWSVASGTGTATINASGLLTATSTGTVTVKATANDASRTEGTKVITISNYATSITVFVQGGSPSMIDVKLGTLQMGETVNPEATDKSVTWSATNITGSATIDASGLLTARANGTVIVKATAKDGSGIEGTKIVNIYNQINVVSSIDVIGEGDANTITTNGGTLQMIETVNSDATDKTVTWSVDDGTGTAIISVNGLLTATSTGTITVKATANDGYGTEGTTVITISNSLSNMSKDTDSIKIYPNPVADKLYINGKDIESVVIRNMAGKTVFQTSNPGKYINLSQLSVANYIITIKTSNGNIVKRIIKK